MNQLLLSALDQPDSGWNAGNWVTLIGSVVTVAGACITGLITYRGSQKSNRDKIEADSRAAREKLEADERAAERVQDLERQRLQEETIASLRAHLEGIISRLTEEVDNARRETQRLREQVNAEQNVSDALRSRVRSLEDQIHEMGQTIADLRRQLIADDAAAALRNEPQPAGEAVHE